MGVRSRCDLWGPWQQALHMQLSAQIMATGGAADLFASVCVDDIAREIIGANARGTWARSQIGKQRC
eukprot:8410174-Pyramimonas_sp.AAC.1